MNENEAITVPVRDINTITSEIRYIQNDVQLYAAQGALKIGERLSEAKEMLGHGEFLPWLKDEFGWTERTAQRLMAVYSEYGSGQKNIFGPDRNTTTFSYLSVSKLYLLISVPESEREEFAEDNNVDEISVRELEKLIKEKKEAEERATTWQNEVEEIRQEKNELAKAVTAEREALNEKKIAAYKDGMAKGASDAETKYSSELNTAKLHLEDAEKAKKEAEAALKKALDDAEKYKADAEKLRDNPQIPEETLAKIREQYAAQVKAAEEKAAKAAADLAAAETKVKLSDANVAVFKVHFENVQKEFSTMLSLIPQMDAETGGKMKNAVAAVLDNFRKAVT